MSELMVSQTQIDEKEAAKREAEEKMMGGPQSGWRSKEVRVSSMTRKK